VRAAGRYVTTDTILIASQSDRGVNTEAGLDWTVCAAPSPSSQTHVLQPQSVGRSVEIQSRRYNTCIMDTGIHVSVRVRCVILGC